MGFSSFNGNWIGRHSGKSWSSYWTHQPEVLFFGLYSEISGGQMPNKVDGGATYLTVAGSAGSETYQCPNTAAYIAADTDYIWFKTDATQRTTTTAELIGYDFPRTPVKYEDDAPYAIVAIMILKSGETITGTKLNKLFQDMWLHTLWDNNLNAYGHIKGNKLAQTLWTPEVLMEAEVATYITGLTTPLSGDQITRLNILVSSIKIGMSINNLSDVFDTMWVLAGETSESSLKNLVKNAHHCTLAGASSPTFAAFEGFTGNILGGAYISTHYNANNDKVNFALDNSGFGIYTRTADALASSKGHGAAGVNERLTVNPVRGANVSRSSVNNNITIQTTHTSNIGMCSVFRYGANDARVASNKTLSEAEVTVSVAIPDYEIYLLAFNSSTTVVGLSEQQISLGYIGRALSPAELNVFFDAFEAYMDDNGKGVI